MAGLNDTHPEAERVLREAYRRMPFAARVRQMDVLYRTAKWLHAMGMRSRNPDATEEMIQDEWRTFMLGKQLVQKIKESRGGKGQGE